MCVPALHISLGIFQRLFQLYEEACHELDVRLAATLTTSPEANQHFNDYVTALKKIVDNEDMIRQCEGIAESNDQLAVWFALDASMTVKYRKWSNSWVKHTSSGSKPTHL